MPHDVLLLALLALPFAGSVAAAFFRANARNAEALLAAAIALAAHLLAWTFYPEMSNGQVIRTSVAWLPAFGLDFTLRLDGFAWLFVLLVTGWRPGRTRRRPIRT